MPRLLSEEPCEVTFNDRISGSKITLYYRMPTTQESVRYSNALVTRRGGRIKSTAGETRQKYGAAILEGFKDGAFATDKGPISSALSSEQYDERWKEHIKKYAPDVIEMLAIHVFESSLEAEDRDQEVEDIDPLQ